MVDQPNASPHFILEMVEEHKSNTNHIINEMVTRNKLCSLMSECVRSVHIERGGRWLYRFSFVWFRRVLRSPTLDHLDRVCNSRECVISVIICKIVLIFNVPILYRLIIII